VLYQTAMSSVTLSDLKFLSTQNHLCLCRQFLSCGCGMG